VTRGKVDHVDSMAVLYQPGSMDAGRTTHVQHLGRRRGKVATQHFLGSQQLQPAQPGGDAVLLEGGLVVPDHGVDVIHGNNDTRGGHRGGHATATGSGYGAR